MPLDCSGVRNFSAGNLATLFIYGALSLNGFVVGVYLQQGAGLTATLAGLASLPTTILMILLSSRAGTSPGRWGPRLFMTVGPLLMAVGALLLLTVARTSPTGGRCCRHDRLGLGLALTVAPLHRGDPRRDRRRSARASPRPSTTPCSRVAGLLVIAMLAAIVGGTLDLDGFHRAAIVTAILMATGGIVSFVGIRNARPVATAPEYDRPAGPSALPDWAHERDRELETHRRRRGKRRSQRRLRGPHPRAPPATSPSTTSRPRRSRPRCSTSPTARSSPARATSSAAATSPSSRARTSS